MKALPIVSVKVQTLPEVCKFWIYILGVAVPICHTCGNGMAFVHERPYNRLKLFTTMETTPLFIAHPSSIINLIDRDDGKKKQTLEKAPSVAFV